VNRPAEHHRVRTTGATSPREGSSREGLTNLDCRDPARSQPNAEQPANPAGCKKPPATLTREPRTAMRYDRARVTLDRHATYIVATFIAGAAQ